MRYSNETNKGVIMIEYFVFVEIKKNKKIGRKPGQTARFLNIDPKTVGKYWNVTNNEFLKMVEEDRKKKRKSRCDKFKPMIVKIIKEINEVDTSTIFDRLLEEYGIEAIDFSPRTLRNYVIKKEIIRQ